MKREKNNSYCYEKGSAKLCRVIIIIMILKYLSPRLYYSIVCYRCRGNNALCSVYINFALNGGCGTA